MSGITATTPESSGVSLDKKTLKQLTRRSDRPGLIYLGLWALFLVASGALLFISHAFTQFGGALLISGLASIEDNLIQCHQRLEVVQEIRLIQLANIEVVLRKLPLRQEA